MDCEGKVAIVTGAAGNGMGRSIALTLAREGACTVVNYRTSEESAGAIVDHIRSRGGQAAAVRADVSRPEGCRELVETTQRAFGRIDICIIGPGGGWHPEPIEKLDGSAALDDAHRELAPLYHLLPLVLPAMYERRWWRIIGISVNAVTPAPTYAYTVGKAARTSALRLAASAAWPQGVTANVIAPGPVQPIPSLELAVELCDHGAGWTERANVTPQDIAEGVAMLCSEAGRFITGCELTYGFH